MIGTSVVKELMLTLSRYLPWLFLGHFFLLWTRINVQNFSHSRTYPWILDENEVYISTFIRLIYAREARAIRRIVLDGNIIKCSVALFQNIAEHNWILRFVLPHSISKNGKINKNTSWTRKMSGYFNRFDIPTFSLLSVQRKIVWRY